MLVHTIALALCTPQKQKKKKQGMSRRNKDVLHRDARAVCTVYITARTSRVPKPSQLDWSRHSPLPFIVLVCVQMASRHALASPTGQQMALHENISGRSGYRFGNEKILHKLFSSGPFTTFSRLSPHSHLQTQPRTITRRGLSQ